ncbi:TetR/AcrR family transcriptional regulator C-terminal domain-containing protein [Streptomyces sp. NBS 14/10]|uniref:TetR/AcrR family transcriptional regulator n=1 Tax=Streptomyces sp. NBS 14/10 TaxID=1945643 RepID=UPI000B802BA1|nr:TetR/AcrR family transcriptional regulator C-terminal domain-containing protein [Streptomyces sp. NBS 14/10]KAK1186228.1 TetR/AcrR family transcriptional regulator C-terminal domain-containing protein [Streptomyces sp. NBS 14/10]NUS84066.1 TetR/AcrR family transcriptional regulator [Streptomyces sp.]
MVRRTAKGSARAPRRTAGLSRELIIETAIELLDSGGEKALTLRELTVRLSTGYGAIYHHVADKNDLLATAADDVITGVLSGAVTDADPRTALRRLALGLFDAIDAHPWVGAELSRQPWRPALLDFYETIGRSLDALDVPEKARVDAAGTLMNYVLGVAAQNAANARLRAGSDTDRETFLEHAAAQWAQIDPGRYPFVHAAATQLREHDDREQFLVGVDIFLAGISALR